MNLDDLKYLKVDLPEDILKLKSIGYVDKAVEIIDMRLEKDLPLALRKRLELEKLILADLKIEYPYTFDEALELMQKRIKDLKKEELEYFRDIDAADWAFVDGEIHFQRLFCDNLIKTRPELAARLFDEETSKNDEKKLMLLNDNVITMKQNGKTAYSFHIRFDLEVKEEYAVPGKIVKVHLPIPNNSMQVKNVKILSTTPEAKIVAPYDYPSRTVYFEVDLKDCRKFSVEYYYEMHMVYNNPDPEKVSAVQPTFETHEYEPHIMFTPFLKELAHEIVKDEKNPLKQARLIYDFITTKVMYTYVRKYFNLLQIPEYVALNLKGDCGVQAILFITLCRYLGIPAKWQSGLYVTPYNCGGHDWAQFYIEPYGWMFADLSFGGSYYRKGDIEKWNYYFGNVDPFRMVANSEFQHEFEPPKKFMRYDPTDNQYGECEFEDRALFKKEYCSDYTVVKVEKLY